MTSQKSVEVTDQPPIETTDIRIDVVRPSWQAVIYNIYDKGSSHSENIPDSADLYVTRINYRDSLFYSQPFLIDDLVNTEMKVSFDFYLESEKVYCQLQSPTSQALNDTVTLRDIETDSTELMKLFKE